MEHNKLKFFKTIGVIVFLVFEMQLITPIGIAQNEEEIGVSVSEDLMREHGVLRRVLLIYEECIKRLNSNQDISPKILQESTEIIQSFIENYHEKLEEDYLFPRFENAAQMKDLVNILRAQHQAGRIFTAQIRNLADYDLTDINIKNKLVDLMKKFIFMYRPHAAREDTVLFPAFKRIVSAKEYSQLADEFEDKEHELFGEDGFDSIVEKVASLEKRLGINDLSSYTLKTY